MGPWCCAKGSTGQAGSPLLDSQSEMALQVGIPAPEAFEGAHFGNIPSRYQKGLKNKKKKKKIATLMKEVIISKEGEME